MGGTLLARSKFRGLCLDWLSEDVYFTLRFPRQRSRTGPARKLAAGCGSVCRPLGSVLGTVGLTGCSCIEPSPSGTDQTLREDILLGPTRFVR